MDFTNSLQVCTWAAMLFMFFTMLRKSNVLPSSTSGNTMTKVQSHVLYNDFLLVNVTWLKTLQFSDRVLYIPVTAISNCILCPVQAYKSLLSMVCIPPSSSAFSHVSQGVVIPLTYSVSVTQFRSWLSQIGVCGHKLYYTQFL